MLRSMDTIYVNTHGPLTSSITDLVHFFIVFGKYAIGKGTKQLSTQNNKQDYFEESLNNLYLNEF